MSEVKELIKNKKRILYVLAMLVAIISLSFYLLGIYGKQLNQGSKAKIGETSELVVDLNSQKVLYQKNSAKARPLASLTKLMTIYLTYEALENNQINLSEELELPYLNDSQAVSLRSITGDEKTQWSVADLMAAAMVMSANDAAEALGNRLAGGENEFIQQMNQKAQELKLSKKTNFTSASGLPTEKGESMATAKDLAILAEALVTDYPQVLEQTRTASWTLSTGAIIDSTNDLLTKGNQHNFEVDGLKTGYTTDAGYCYIGIASKEEQRLLVIVLGTKNSDERFSKAENLLQKYFD